MRDYIHKIRLLLFVGLFLFPIFLSLLPSSFYHLPFSFCLLPFGCGGGSGSNADLNLSAQSCGNGKMDAGEACDDGNANNSDGCNAHCAFEVGESTCGNGVLENDECCDDANNVSGDGCSENCTLEKNNHPPTAPLLADEPHNGAEWAPTRLYLSWNASSDPDLGDQISYDVYFVEGNGISPTAFPYKQGITNTHFIIQASTDNRPEFFPDLVRSISLEPNHTYTWKVCARDKVGASSCSPSRIFNTDDSVVGWWRFDEDPNAGVLCPGAALGSGKTVCDYSGKGNHGTPHGNPQWLNSDQSGMVGGALNFDGVDDWVEVSNDDSLNPDSITVVAIVEPMNKIGEFSILDKRYGLVPGPAGYNFRFDGTSYPLVYNWIIVDSTSIGELFTSTTQLIQYNTKYFLSAAFDLLSGNSNVSINGNMINSRNFGSVNYLPKNTVDLFIGEVGHLSRPSGGIFKGQIDEIVIYRRALNEIEISNNYQSSKLGD